jgi:hypothetical protein
MASPILRRPDVGINSERAFRNRKIDRRERFAAQDVRTELRQTRGFRLRHRFGRFGNVERANLHVAVFLQRHSDGVVERQDLRVRKKCGYQKQPGAFHVVPFETVSGSVRF